MSSLEWQPGGCMSIHSDQTKRRAIGMVKHKSVFGIWVWKIHRGIKNTTLRIISAHSCGSGPRPSTAFSQQIRCFDNIDDSRTHKQAFIEGIVFDLIEWIADGDHIVLMMDAKEHIQTGNLVVALEEIGINEAITARYQES